MLWRKRQKDIIDWIYNERKALLITGARQIGKTFLIKKTLERENCDFVEFNLIKQPEIIKLLESVSNDDCKTFLERLTIATTHDLKKGKTIIFFDEIQEYKEIVTKIKFLVEDGSFKYVFSGSLLGVELTGLKSAPVGYLNTIEMFPLDFEEYILALNIKRETINKLKNHFEEKTKVDEFVHDRMIEAFKSYLLVGGMPEAVVSYISEGDYNKVYNIHLSIIEQYKLDFTKYEKEKRLKLKKIYDLIPAELADKNKRYVFKDVDPNIKYDRYENSFNWLIDAGVALPVYNTTEPVIPLEINKKSNIFKLFLSDVGLLTTLYGTATVLKLLSKEKDINYGAVFENFVAEELRAHGYKEYFYNSKKYGELDFVIEHMGEILPIEVKSGKDYKVHSALNNIVNLETYKINNAIVLSNYNVSVKDNITYYPIYMTMFINERNIVVPKMDKIDFSELD